VPLDVVAVVVDPRQLVVAVDPYDVATVPKWIVEVAAAAAVVVVVVALGPIDEINPTILEDWMLCLGCWHTREQRVETPRVELGLAPRHAKTRQFDWHFPTIKMPHVTIVAKRQPLVVVPKMTTVAVIHESEEEQRRMALEVSWSIEMEREVGDNLHHEP